MSEDQVQEIKLALERLVATLGERCAHRQTAIDQNAEDIDAAFRKVREVKESLHQQNVLLAKWSLLSSIVTAALTAYVVKLFVG